jgi:hypothetical protein
MQNAVCTKRRKYGSKLEKIADKQKKTVADFTNEKKQCIKEKRKCTCKRLYGVEHSMQSSEVREKARQTSRNNYGVDYPMQSSEFRKTVIGRKYLYDGVSFDSSDELALYIWLSDHRLKFEF